MTLKRRVSALESTTPDPAEPHVVTVRHTIIAPDGTKLREVVTVWRDGKPVPPPPG